MGGGVGGGTAGGAGAGAGGALVLIDQVQVMSVIGRTGGKSAANEDAAAFSEGFGWANFDSNSFFKSSEEKTREPPPSCLQPA